MLFHHKDNLTSHLIGGVRLAGAWVEQKTVVIDGNTGFDSHSRLGYKWLLLGTKLHQGNVDLVQDFVFIVHFRVGRSVPTQLYTATRFHR